MKILVTGAGGNANRILIPQLIELGHEIIATDVIALDYDCELHRVSIFDDLVLSKSMKGADCVVHAAGTADHALPRSPECPDAYDQWWQMSTVSTHHLYRAALYAEVPKVIFFGTQEFYSYGHGPGVIDEEYPASRPAKSYYDLGKVISEDIARYYAARHQIDCVMLRPGNFTGCPKPGPEFLANRLRREDMAQAVRLSVGYEPEDHYEAFNVMAGNPFKPEDLDDLQHKPMDLIERYYPGAKSLMERAGHIWKGTDRLRCIHKAQEKLGYKPAFTFESFLKSLGWSEVQG